MGSQITTGSTATTKVCLPRAQCTRGQDSSQVPRPMTMGPSAPTKPLYSWIDAEFSLLRWGTKMSDVLCHHDSDVALGPGFSLGAGNIGTFSLQLAMISELPDVQIKSRFHYKSQCLHK